MSSHKESSAVDSFDLEQGEVENLPNRAQAFRKTLIKGCNIGAALCSTGSAIAGGTAVFYFGAPVVGVVVGALGLASGAAWTAAASIHKGSSRDKEERNAQYKRLADDLARSKEKERETQQKIEKLTERLMSAEKQISSLTHEKSAPERHKTTDSEKTRHADHPEHFWENFVRHGFDRNGNEVA